MLDRPNIIVKLYNLIACNLVCFCSDLRMMPFLLKQEKSQHSSFLKLLRLFYGLQCYLHKLLLVLEANQLISNHMVPKVGARVKIQHSMVCLHQGIFI